MRFAGAAGKANVGMSNDNAGDETRTPKNQGFLINVNRIRVSRVLRITTKTWEADGKLVNIPTPVLLR